MPTPGQQPAAGKPIPPPLPPRRPHQFSDKATNDLPINESSIDSSTGSCNRNPSDDDLYVSNSSTHFIHPEPLPPIHVQPMTPSNSSLIQDSNPEFDSSNLEELSVLEGNPGLSRSRSGSPTPPLSHIQADTTSESSFCLDSNPNQPLNNLVDVSQDLKHDDKVDEIEELEVDEFLRRSSKYLDQVEIQTTELTETPPPPIPKISDFRLNDRTDSNTIDWIGFFDAFLLSQLERYCPNALRSSPTPPAVSISQIRAQATRSYITIFPELQGFFSANQIISIYRWEKPRRTALYLAIYYILWLMDLIPVFIVGYALYLLINRQLNPPTVSQLKQVSQRHQLGKQAEVMGSEGFFGTKTGTTGSIAKGVMANSMAFAGVAVGTNPYHTNNAVPPPSGTVQKPPSNLPKINGYRGLYALGRGLYSEYGLEIQIFLADLADIGEKVRNLYLWRRPHACRRTTFMLVGIFIYTLIFSQKWIVKNFLGWLGIEFFFIFQFTDKNPKFRKVLNPIWLLLYEIPTDSEFALEILQERGKSNNPLISSSRKIKNSYHHHFKPNDLLHKRSKSAHSISSDLNSTLNSSDHNSIHSSSKSSKRESLSILDKSTYKNVLDSDNLKHWGHKVVRGSSEAIKLVKREGDEKTQPTDQPDSNVTNPSTKLKTFATLGGKLPGNLVVNKEEICFEPMKGFRTMTCNVKTSLIQAPNTKKESIGTVSSPASKLLTNNPNDPDIHNNRTSIDQEDVSLLLSKEEKVKIDPCQDDQHRNCLDLEQNHEDDNKTLDSSNLIIPFKQILKIKKVKKSLLFGVGFRISDGIELHLDNSSVISFDNIINRDHYFNQLVTICHAIDK